MTRPIRSILRAIAAVRFATLEIKFDLLLRALERRYRPDQPRAPKGTPEGGQWIDDLFSASQQALRRQNVFAWLSDQGVTGFQVDVSPGALLVQPGCSRFWAETFVRTAP